MGRGRSGLKSGGGGGGAKTPSGVTYDQFMQMSDAQKYQTIQDIIDDSSIQVPSILDGSDTTKVMYGLGMTGKTTVVSDSQLDAMPGKDLFRTVYEDRTMPPPSSDAILDQIRNGDFTQLSGKGGSAHGRALYFARDDFTGSTVYGNRGKNAMVMRTKLNTNAKIVKESNLRAQMRADSAFMARHGGKSTDAPALFAIAHGIDGWFSGSYTMIVNRGALTSSSQNKSIMKQLKSGKASTARKAVSWSDAANT